MSEASYSVETLKDIFEGHEERRRNPLPKGWQPEETAPLGEYVLTYDGDMDIGEKHQDGTWALKADYTGMNPRDWKPTYWMKLPVCPVEG